MNLERSCYQEIMKCKVGNHLHIYDNCSRVCFCAACQTHHIEITKRPSFEERIRTFELNDRQAYSALEPINYTVIVHKNQAKIK